MPSWWSRQKSVPAPEPEPEPQDYDTDEDPWAALRAQAGDDVEEEEPEPEPRADLESRIDAEMQDRAKALREKLAAHGLDLSEEGEPVIKDPKRFREWARPAVAVEAQQTKQEPPPVKELEPKPAPAPDTDVWEMTPEQFREAVRREAEALVKPVLDEVRQTRGLVGKQYVNEATRKAQDALQQVAPDYMHILDHPQFEEMYRNQLSNLPPEYLDNQQVLASTALGLVAWLDPDQMPAKKAHVEDPAARAAVNRSLVPQSRPALDQSAAAGGRALPDEYELGARWLAQQRVARISPEEMMALDATDEKGLHTIEAYERAKRKIEKARGVRR